MVAHLLFYLAFFIVLAYLLGSIPFGLVICHFLKIDLRLVGSGNTGATNVFRAAGPQWGIFVFVLDFLKGLLPTLLAMHMFSAPVLHIVVGSFAIMGHTWPVFAGFRGGKGVATGLGLLAALHPLSFLMVFVYAVTVIMVTRIVSLASLSGSVAVVFLFLFFHVPQVYLVFSVLVMIFIFYLHRANIFRLIHGTENKLSFGKKEGS